MTSLGRVVTNRRQTTRDEYRRRLRMDLQAHNVPRWHPLLVLKRPELYYQRLMRRVEFLQANSGLVTRLALYFARYRLQRVSVRTGISFPPGVADGGLSIAHYGSIVVNRRAKIGKFCRIHSATNIGVARGGVPKIGDFVYIGPGAVIYGGVNVGSGAVVGANAVVNRDVPDGVTVAGAPARVVSDSDSSGMMPEWFPNYRRPSDA